MNDFFLRIRFDNDTILAELLLDQDDLFCAVDDKVTAWIEWAFVEQVHFVGFLVRQDTFGTPQHDRHATDGYTALCDFILSTLVCEIYKNRGGVGHIAQSALVWGNGRVRLHAILGLIASARTSDVDIGEPADQGLD